MTATRNVILAPASVAIGAKRRDQPEFIEQPMSSSRCGRLNE